MDEHLEEDHQSPDTPGAPRPASKRRRTSAPSSRGVANLTPEQLARKRANDREAQRAIRERTKTQIEKLNARICELESQQPYHELQLVLRQKDQIQAENDDIRRRLSSVMSIIQPILGTHGLNELAAAAERSPLPLPPHDGDPRAPQAPMHIPDQRPFHPQVPSPHDQTNASSPGSQASNGRHWTYPGLPPTSHVRTWPGQEPQYEQPRSNIHPDLEFAQSDERLGVNFLLDNGQRVAKLSNGVVDGAAPPPGMENGAFYSGRPLEGHNTLPRSIDPTCPLDSLLLDFLTERCARAAEGVPMKTLIGPAYPDFSSLLQPDRALQAHPLSKVFTDILRTFPDISALPEKVAVLYTMFLLMRWQIEPTQENYERLPDWMTPRPTQLFTPHPVWHDYLPWPRLRDRMVQLQPQTHQFNDFFIPFTTTVSVNWPYEARDVLLPAQPPASSTPTAAATPAPGTATAPTNEPAASGTEAPGSPSSIVAAAASSSGAPGGEQLQDEWVINPAFESHIRNLENWSLGPAFRTAFPMLADYVRIRES
ncbi:hypothetical protein K490DRAFT_40856 [Saccharata proteae CBS 121410]|uniref:BZIP transcription factor n=1 Tax=Saccharata proteae CBS 121410 TaxID=1314787 RepID=A0A9P4LZA6_9PEZI|nr:hypothetical protein K490DRAFT_40856 [Saccharata proteae CBS 121410]